MKCYRCGSEKSLRYLGRVDGKDVYACSRCYALGLLEYIIEELFGEENC